MLQGIIICKQDNKFLCYDCHKEKCEEPSTECLEVWV